MITDAEEIRPRSGWTPCGISATLPGHVHCYQGEEPMAKVADFLVSDAASFVTGATMM